MTSSQLRRQIASSRGVTLPETQRVAWARDRSTETVRPMTPPRAGERGMALMTTMFFTMLMLMLAAALVTNASTETRISANHVSRLQAFYAAEAGLEQAKSWLGDNRGDTDLMNALLVESQNATPDQSSLTRPDATVVATPLGLQTFATGTYNVVISDNADDGDPLTDSDSRWIITSQGGGPANASQLLEVEVLAAASVTPMGAVSFSTPTVNLDRKRGLLYPRVLVGTGLWRHTTL